MADTVFIAFGDDWGAHASCTQHLMGRVAEKHPVIWVDSIGMRRPSLGGADLKRLAAKGRAALGRKDGAAAPAGSATMPESLEIVHPRVYPDHLNPLAVRLNRLSLRRQLLPRLKRFGDARRVLLSSLPTAAPYLGACGEELTAYYCLDDYENLPGVEAGLARRTEAAILERADLVYATSTMLVEEKSRPGRPARLLDHGVDAAHFARPGPLPAALAARIEHPVVGFFGNFNEWVDLELIAETARRLPDLTFLLVGKQEVDVSRLERLPNAILTGPVAYRELPGYAALFDAALIPFRVNRLTERVNPLKLKEYLACGLPVVSTPLPEAGRYRPDVALAAAPEEFAEALRKALAEDSPAKKRARRARVAGETWEARAAGFLKDIEEKLAEPARRGEVGTGISTVKEARRAPVERLLQCHPVRK